MWLLHIILDEVRCELWRRVRTAAPPSNLNTCMKHVNSWAQTNPSTDRKNIESVM